MHTPELRRYFVEYVPDDIAPATDQFMFTPEFRRHFVEFVPGDTLMKLRLATKGWKPTAEAFIDEGVRSGAMIVHGGKDISWGGDDPRWDMRKLATQVIFLLNITKVGEFACYCAVNLVVVNIPEGIESISIAAFRGCQSLTTVSFPKTLRLIGGWAFGDCSSLENVDLLHTNLQELGNYAFSECPELKLMTIPDSLQTIHRFSRTFHDCFKLVPSNMDIYDSDGVITYLRSKQNQF
ncbi:hypothetical protein TL16_g11694 [Triparma laevis f. inornata]|uniref:Leucine-rich repeat domain-containing protein n=1 Tax=Triparma laevis f. inornata TaxID=1714386 RepID=A0A9W7EU81_9STRA|nr:hypothetical protein TL16_g11694 [Triparma laevis f. inornata]